MQEDRSLARVAERLRTACHVVVLTGAGISAESGVPTFRDAQVGIWARYDPTELATPEAFVRDPVKVWSWYLWRRELIRKARPNPGHLALVTIENRVPKFALVTQNVDNLHREAGSRNVLELHGNIFRTVRANDRKPVAWDERGELPPRCLETGVILRPDVVWFGEPLPEDVLRSAFALAREADLLLVVGTSGVVQPAAQIPFDAKQHGTFVVEVNPDTTPITAMADVHLGGPAGELLPALVAHAWPSEP